MLGRRCPQLRSPSCCVCGLRWPQQASRHRCFTHRAARVGCAGRSRRRATAVSPILLRVWAALAAAGVMLSLRRLPACICGLHCPQLRRPSCCARGLRCRSMSTSHCCGALCATGCPQQGVVLSLRRLCAAHVGCAGRSSGSHAACSVASYGGSAALAARRQRRAPSLLLPAALSGAPQAWFEVSSITAALLSCAAWPCAAHRNGMRLRSP